MLRLGICHLPKVAAEVQNLLRGGARGGGMSEPSEEFDFLMFKGSIGSSFADTIENQTREHKFPELRFALTTGGGDPDEAYRAMRILQCRYDRVVLMVPGPCKSAGTLVALGAHELAFGLRGELGPLDIQLTRKDELMGSESGANVISAMSALHSQAFELFEYFLLQVTARSQGNISAKMATHVASDVTKGIYEAIFRQIDPHHVGETQRAMLIGEGYGTRLASHAENIDDVNINMLIMGYPSHGFVIDQAEAEKLFKRVRNLSFIEQALLNTVGADAAMAFGSMSNEAIQSIKAAVEAAEASLGAAGEPYDQDDQVAAHCAGEPGPEDTRPGAEQQRRGPDQGVHENDDDHAGGTPNRAR